MDKRTFLKNMALLSAGTAVGLKPFARSLATQSLPIAPFQPDPLSYDFAALEPHIDTETMNIHYSKHYQAYITNLNKALKGSAYASKNIMEIITTIPATEKAIRNNAGGYYNHSLFWKWLSPKVSAPNAALKKAIDSSFGSLDNFKAEFSKASMAVFGSGWTWLIVQNGKLKIVSTPNQDNPLNSFAEEKGTPILGLDIWEHAYYLKHQNKRADYVQAFWNVVNWPKVSEDYSATLHSK